MGRAGPVASDPFCNKAALSEIDVVERSFRLVRHKRQKYTCRRGECVETALGPPKLIAGGRYSVGFGKRSTGGAERTLAFILPTATPELLDPLPGELRPVADLVALRVLDRGRLDHHRLALVRAGQQARATGLRGRVTVARSCA